MIPQKVSVVVVSRGRPELLKRCLAGLSRLFHPTFEVIVVADPAGAAAVRAGGLRAKLAEFDSPNISEARNIGIGLAAGDVVAFLDDDAVPEPTWLTHLAAPFSDDGVAAAGGYVRGRNGISFQWKASRVDVTGAERPIDVPGGELLILKGRKGDAIKTQGTNCAFRRDLLVRLGGFDPAFHFYLDETDLNMRLAEIGARTAIVPLAQVHHGFAASDRRLASRLPVSLHQIGASSAVFRQKHAPDRDPWGALAQLQAEQRRRLVAHMVAGNCEPRDVGRLLSTLRDGWIEGAARDPGDMPDLRAAPPPFLAFHPPGTAPVASKFLAGRIWHRRRLRARAGAEARSGRTVSLYLFSPTALYHRVIFRPEGFWEQRGGLFGRAERSEKIFRLTGIAARAETEWRRVAGLRHSGKKLTPLDDGVSRSG